MHRGKQTRKTLKQTPKKHLELGVEELAGVNYQDLELGQKEKCCKNLPSWVLNVPMECLSQLEASVPRGWALQWLQEGAGVVTVTLMGLQRPRAFASPSASLCSLD